MGKKTKHAAPPKLIAPNGVLTLSLSEKEAFGSIVQRITLLEELAGKVLTEIHARVGLPEEVKLTFNRATGEVSIVKPAADPPKSE